MSHYLAKLIPDRPTFAFDMTDEERATMQQHSAYWRGLMREGRVVVFGPVMDPSGVYGMGVLNAETEDAARQLLARDPACHLMRTELCPMQAVTSA